MTNNVLLILFGIGVAFSGVTTAQPAGLGILEAMEPAEIEMINDAGEVIRMTVRVADEPHEWYAGFQYIPKTVIEETIILFVFEVEIDAQVHMNNVLAPLEIAFIAADGRILDIKGMYPNSGELYGTDRGNFKYAIEARLGFFTLQGISEEGSSLVVSSLPFTSDDASQP
ncbi:MAG: DUF192 domain-containing protein [Candidatus Bipolaricaulia bacterium]